MEILVISGLSGSGKSRVAAYLEDIGYYIVDNLPAEMMVVLRISAPPPRGAMTEWRWFTTCAAASLRRSSLTRWSA